MSTSSVTLTIYYRMHLEIYILITLAIQRTSVEIKDLGTRMSGPGHNSMRLTLDHSCLQYRHPDGALITSTKLENNHQMIMKQLTNYVDQEHELTGSLSKLNFILRNEV